MNRIFKAISIAFILFLPTLEMGCGDPVRSGSSQSTHPEISSMTPTMGPTSGGTYVRVFGDHLSSQTLVFFGDKPASEVHHLSSAELLVVAPPMDEGEVPIRAVTQDGIQSGIDREEAPQTSARLNFTFYNPAERDEGRPLNAQLAITRGPISGGTINLITADGLSPEGVVFLGHRIASLRRDIIGPEDSYILETPPSPEAGEVDVVLQNPDGQSAVIVDGFTYHDPELIPVFKLNEVDPPSGSSTQELEVKLMGEGLPSSQERPLVLFNAYQATTLTMGETAADNGSMLTVLLPAQPAGSARVWVTTRDGFSASLAEPFLYRDAPSPLPLQLLSSSPSVLSESSPVELRITGVGFGEGLTATLKVANGELSYDLSVNLLDSNRAQVSFAEALPVGSYQLSVSMPNGETSALEEALRVDALETEETPTLALTLLSPSQAYVDTPMTAWLIGSGFQSTHQVRVDGRDVESAYFDPTLIEVDLPALSRVGELDIQVTVGDPNSELNPEQTATLVGGLSVVERPPASSERLVLIRLIPEEGSSLGGTPVTIRGAGFSSDTRVNWGRVELEPTLIDENTLIVEAPPRGMEQEISVSLSRTADASRSDELSYTYLEPATSALTVDYVDPLYAEIGTETAVLIKGEGLSGATVVEFGDTPAVNLGMIDQRTLMVLTPQYPEVERVDLSVTTVETADSLGVTEVLEDAFQFVASEQLAHTPVITEIEPTIMIEDQDSMILIHGENLGESATILINGEAAEATPLSDELIVANVNALGAGAVAVAVQLDNGTSDQVESGLVVVGADAIGIPINDLGIEVSPRVVLTDGGTPITITGANLDLTEFILINDQLIDSFEVISEDRITLSAPRIDTTGSVDLTLVRRYGLMSIAEDALTYRFAPPQILRMSPERGPEVGGTVCQIFGSGLRDGVIVSFGGRPAQVLELISDQAISVITPSGPRGGVDVTVENADGQFDTLVDGFTFGDLAGGEIVVHDAFPNMINPQGGVRVLVNGQGFTPDLSVSVNGSPATDVVVVSERQFTMLVPSSDEAATNLVISNGQGQQVEHRDLYRYYTQDELAESDPSEPVISGISPRRGAIEGGGQISLAGGGFDEESLVFFDGYPALTTTFRGETLLVTTPVAHPEALVDVEVTTSAGFGVKLEDGFDYVQGLGGGGYPDITSTFPSRVSAEGGVRLLISGQHFQEGDQVFIGGRSADDVFWVNESALTLITPAAPAGVYPITVIHQDGRSDTLNDALTYYSADPSDQSVEIRGIFPNYGLTVGGERVFVTGQLFNDHLKVYFGPVPGVVSAVNGDSLLEVVTPASTSGVVDITVVNEEGRQATLHQSFTFTSDATTPPPTLSRITPQRGSESGGTQCLIVGAGFHPEVDVLFGGRPAEVEWLSSQELLVNTPANLVGPVNVIAVNPDGQTFTLNQGFTYLEALESDGQPEALGVTPSVSPEAGGVQLVINGRGFENTPTVFIGSKLASDVTFLSEGLIRITAPAHSPGQYDVVVVNPNGLVGRLPAALSYTAQPELLEVIPNRSSTSGGSTVNLSGFHFQEGAHVYFGEERASRVTWLGPNVLEVVTPESLQDTVSLIVENPDGQRALLEDAFHFVAPPTLSSVSPSQSPDYGGGLVVLRGESFSPSTQVFFGDLPALSTHYVNSTTLTVEVPPSEAGVYSIRVTEEGVASDVLDGAFTRLTVGQLGDVSEFSELIPAQSPLSGGGVFTLTGERLTNNIQILIDYAPVINVVLINDQTVSVVMPPWWLEEQRANEGGGEADHVVDIHIIGPDGQTVLVEDALEYLDEEDLTPAPVLISLSPETGPTAGGQTVELNGVNFTPGSTVYFGVERATDVQLIDQNLIRLLSPSVNASLVDVTITSFDGQSSRLDEAYRFLPPPVVDGVTPNRAPANQSPTVLINGAHFRAGASVQLGGDDALSVVYVDTQTLQATFAMPVNPHVGALDLKVTNPDGQSVTLEDGFSFIPPPEVSSCDPARGPSVGGEEIQIYGLGFLPGAQVKVGENTAQQVTWLTAEHLSVRTPPGVAGPAAITVTNPDGQAFVLAGGYAFVNAPRIDSIFPTSGPLGGGTRVEISGNFLDEGAQVLIGNQPAADITYVSRQVITARTPEGVAGPAAIIVENVDQQRGVLAAGFTYVPPRPDPTITGISPNYSTELGGKNITVLGTAFQFGASVFFGDVEATEVEVLNASYLRVRAPGHAPGLVDLTVTNPTGESVTALSGFNYTSRGELPPVAVTDVMPDTGSIHGNQSVLIVGAGFSFGTQVVIGGVPCAEPSYISPTVISCITGPHDVGVVEVTATTSEGESGTLEAGFTYSQASPLILDGYRIPPATERLYGVVKVDFDGDQDEDIYLYDHSNSIWRNRLYVNDGSGRLSLLEIEPIAYAHEYCEERSSYCSPKAIAFGDIDGDGDQDVVMNYQGSPGHMGIFVNQGDFTFTHYRLCPSGCNTLSLFTNAYSIELVDLDTDGDLDLIVMDTESQVALLFNQGLEATEGDYGSLFIHDDDAIPAANEKMYRVAHGDVDGDGDIDLLFANLDEQQNRLYLNDGTGHYTDVTLSHFGVSGGQTRATVLWDVDGDDDLDAFIVNEGQQDQLFINDGQGFFEDQTLGRLPDQPTAQTIGATFGDIDGDGDSDLILNRADAPYLQVMINMGSNSGVFNDFSDDHLPGVWRMGTPYSFLDDYDSDGDLDLINVIDNYQTQLLINDGEGNFEDVTQEFLPNKNNHTNSIAAGDVDGDGDADLVSCEEDGEINLMLNDGSGHFFDHSEERLPEILALECSQISLRDINGDGDLDLFVISDRSYTRTDSHQDRFFANDGAGFFTLIEESIPNQNDSWGMGLADVDLDGDLEFFRHARYATKLYDNLGDPYRNDFGHFNDIGLGASNSQSASIASAISFQDFDDDGDLDLFMGYYSRQNQLWLNNYPEQSFTDVTSSHIPSISDQTRSLIDHDFDDDGDIDLLLINYDQRPRLHLNQGNGTFADVSTTSIPDLTNQRYMSGALIDIDGDGDEEIFLGAWDFKANTLLMDVGNHIYEHRPDLLSVTPHDQTRAVIAVDVDGDCDQDLVVANWGQDRIYFNELNSEVCHRCQGQSIPYSQVCDGVEHCSDGSDETDCLECGGEVISFFNDIGYRTGIQILDQVDRTYELEIVSNVQRRNRVRVQFNESCDSVTVEILETYPNMCYNHNLPQCELVESPVAEVNGRFVPVEEGEQGEQVQNCLSNVQWHFKGVMHEIGEQLGGACP